MFETGGHARRTFDASTLEHNADLVCFEAANMVNRTDKALNGGMCGVHVLFGRAIKVDEEEGEGRIARNL